MTELTVQNDALSAEMDYARVISSAALLPQAYRGKPADILIAMGLGEAIGITRTQALYEIYVVNGRPSPSANLMAALVRRAGHKLRVQGDAKSCTATLIRADDPEAPFVATWTIEQANAAKLTGKDTWKQYPGAMLRARAVAEVVRMGAPEAVLGMEYSREEMGDVGPVPPPTPSERSATATLRNVVAPTATTSHPEAADDATPVVDAVSDDPGDVMTARSRGEMFALFNQKGADTREKQLKAIKHYAGVEPESRGDLTEQQALDVINGLRKLKDAQPEEPPAEPEHLTDEEFQAAAEVGRTE